MSILGIIEMIICLSKEMKRYFAQREEKTVPFLFSRAYGVYVLFKCIHNLFL